MRFICATIFCALVVMASASEDAPKQYDLSLGREHFENFIKQFNREYKDEEDKELHYKAFLQNLDKINKMNAASTSATYGINKFADYTDEERQSMFGLKKNDKH